MPPAFFFSLLLVALHASAPVGCRPRGLQGPPGLLPRPPEQGGTGPGAQGSAGVRRSGGSVRRGRSFLVILPLRTPTSNFVSIFDLRRKRFLCMDFKGELYNSKQRDREGCLFQHIWLADHQDVFYSTSSSRLLTLVEAELQGPGWGPPEGPRGPSALMEDLLIPLGKRRRRRSEEVNPSDPLRTESHPSHSARDAELAAPPEQDQVGAVSKETIASCDDPLKVLQPDAPQSPVKSRADQAEQA